MSQSRQVLNLQIIQLAAGETTIKKIIKKPFRWKNKTYILEIESTPPDTHETI